MSRWFLVALLTLSGCAFSLDGPDPNRPRNRMPSCDTSKGAVALDGVMATALGVATLSVAADGGGAAALVPLGIGALYLGGAIAGNNAVNQCRKAQAEYTQSYGNERYTENEERDDDNDDEPQLPKRPRVKYDDPRPTDVYAQPRPPVTAPPVAPVVTTPPASVAAPTTAPPVPTAPPAAPTVKPASPAARPARQPVPAKTNDDEWSDFWREVP